MDEYLTAKEISSVLKVNIISVRRWISSKKLPAIFLGKEYRIKKSDFELFLKERQTRIR